MPLGDGTGPAGFGPMTGRAAGYCAGYPVPGYMNPGIGYPGAFYRAGYPRPWMGARMRRFPGTFGFGRGYAMGMRPFGRGRARGGRGGRGRW